MANQYWLSQLMDMNELLHVVGHGSIIMSRVMGGVTMISEVLPFSVLRASFQAEYTNQGVDSFVEITCKDPMSGASL